MTDEPVPNERMFMRRIRILPMWMQQNVERAARALHSVGGYNGSETDAVTDALYILNNTYNGQYLDADGKPKGA